ncbi:hypothetical protein J6590_020840 [Homalodisca vitripennis]|nr:hypothetical protein J6590_020840 [Homalodisca vitripennis]
MVSFAVEETNFTETLRVETNYHPMTLGSKLDRTVADRLADVLSPIGGEELGDRGVTTGYRCDITCDS